VERIGQLVTDALAGVARTADAFARWVAEDPLIGTGAVLGALLLLLLLARRFAVRASADSPEAVERQVQALIEQNDYGRAGELRMSQGQFDKALALFLNSGDTHKAALCYLALKQPARAAQMYAKMGRHAEAAQYFQTAGAWREAAECLQTLGSDREAAVLFERAGDVARAAHLLRGMGDAENASRLFERAGLGAEAAAALLEARGREPQSLRRAGELFESAGQTRRAGECFAAAGEWLRAAEIFEDAGENMLAAQAYERAERFEQAGTAYERAGALPEARANFDRAGDAMRAASVAVRMGKLLEGARGLYSVGAFERALETLQQIPADSPHAREKGMLLGKIFLEKGLVDRAREQLEAIAAAEPRTAADLSVLAGLAEVHERAGNTAAAIECLERVLAVDERHGDAAQRLARLQQKSGEPDRTPGYYEERYRLREEIGRGGMGVVHLAQDTELGRPVAIKFLPADLAANEPAVGMFRAEARAAAAMNHPNVVQIYDVGTLGGRPCIIMEYVKGKTARELMRAEGRGSVVPLPPRRVAEIARDICTALEYAHAQGVVHRDVKPGNILVGPSGTAKLMDFGISKVLEAGREGLTQAKGTPQYMPPEQILGREVDGRTDLYALGITMFEMVAGRRPFVGEDVVDQQLHAPLPDPRIVRPEIPEALVLVIKRACQKRPAERFASAAEMARALEEFLRSA
jgi:tetratricopeptide (TPR) repeat protein